MQDLQHKRVLIREDLNVPMNDAGVITDDTRLQKALPTIKQALSQQAAVLVMSHLGRPKEGVFDARFSLAPIANWLSQHLGCDVPLIQDWIDGVAVEPGQVVLCENVRFLPGEKANDDALAQKMANLCDVFVMDAFATAHRAQASTAGVAKFASRAIAGPLLQTELQALMPVARDAEKPLVAIVGGSKVSTKIALLDALLDKVDTLIVGGGIANTLLAAKGFAVGNSLYEADWLDKAAALFAKAKQRGVAMPLPTDVVVANAFRADANVRTVPVDAVAEHEMILDVGPQTQQSYAAMMQTAKTIIWNGPVGVFEMAPFSSGTQALAQAIAASAAYSVAGGGDTLAAIAQYAIADDISYISTGGGAFLALMQGEQLPGVSHLQN